MSGYTPKRGDWVCSSCGKNNFASRTTCFGCKKPKPRMGDWTCASCGYVNFVKNTICKKCDHERPQTSTDTQVATITTTAPAAAPKPGDWKCSCGETNFGTRIVCRKCGAERPPNESEGLCAVCLQNRADICLKKCGHVVMCRACSKNVNACPICRMPYSQDEDIIKTYKVV